MFVTSNQNVPIASVVNTSETRHEKTCLMPYPKNKAADQPAHPLSLISVFVVRCLDNNNNNNKLPRHGKTCLRGFRPAKTQTGLRSHRS